MAKKATETLSSFSLDTLTTLFKLLEVEATFDINESEIEESKEKVVTVTIESEEAGLLIGAHGTTLIAIQSFLGMAIKQYTGEWVRVSVDVSGWKEKHEDYLESLALQAAERARSTGENQHLYNLTPAQRRVVHASLTSQEDIVTVSEGEGEDRYLVVSVK